MGTSPQFQPRPNITVTSRDVQQIRASLLRVRSRLANRESSPLSYEVSLNGIVAEAAEAEVDLIDLWDDDPVPFAREYLQAENAEAPYKHIEPR